MMHILAVTMAAIYSGWLGYCLYGWLRLPVFGESVPVDNPETSVTVIIPTRNEENNIQACLQVVTTQNYPPGWLEVIVVNDHSSDHTEELVRTFPSPLVRLVNLSVYMTPGRPLNAYKKKAIETAIGLSKGELILTTDADCVMGKDWVRTLVEGYKKQNLVFMAAPVILHQENSFFKWLQSLDFISLQGLTGAIAELDQGAICNGANLGYSKKAFLEVGGFSGIDQIASGDDVLLMYKMQKAFPRQTAFLKSRKAIVRTLPMETLKEFIQQRIRWSSKVGKMDDRRMLGLLVFMYCWNLLFPVLAVMAIWHPALWKWFFGLILYKSAVELCFLAPVSGFFGKKRLLWLVLPAQFFHIPYILVAAFLGKVKTYQWKGRQVS